MINKDTTIKNLIDIMSMSSIKHISISKWEKDCIALTYIDDNNLHVRRIIRLNELNMKHFDIIEASSNYIMDTFEDYRRNREGNDCQDDE